MKKRVAVLGVVLIAAAVTCVATSFADAKLPKCSKPECRSLGCPADVLCASGTTVKTCAEVCNGH